MGIQSLNDIVNEHSFNRNCNANDNVVKERRSRDEIARADRIADYLCRKIGSTGARTFYCEEAYHLSDDIIYECLKIAIKKGRTPVKYLSWLLKQNLGSKKN